MAFFPITQFDFPNTLAYDSDLRELLKIVTQLSENYNSMYQAYQELMTEFAEIEKQFAEFQKVIDALPSTIANEVALQIAPLRLEIYAHLNSEIERLEGEISEFKTYIDNLYNLVNKRINDTNDTIEVLDSAQTEANNKLRAELLQKIAQIQLDIDDLQWKLPEVYDISTGKHVPLVAALYNEYDALRVHTLTAGKRDSLSYTATKTDELNYTAYEWDVISGHLQDYGKYCPLDGVIQPEIKMIVEMALHLYEDTIKAEDYDELKFTADGYETFGLTGYQYDFHSSAYLDTGKMHTFATLWQMIDMLDMRLRALEG